MVKMRILPKLLYRFNIAPVNRQNGLDQLDKVILEFIRKNKALSADKIFFLKKEVVREDYPYPNTNLIGH